jgi:hypothetical protein
MENKGNKITLKDNNGTHPYTPSPSQAMPVEPRIFSIDIDIDIEDYPTQDLRKFSGLVQMQPVTHTSPPINKYSYHTVSITQQ